MVLLYNISLVLYYGVINVASLFNKKARQFIFGRRGWHHILKSKLCANEKIIWVHCASLGEFEQGRPIIEKIKTDMPEYKILLSFFSPSGFEIRKNYPGADYVCYLPFDFKKNARKFIKLINPICAIFVKYELWYHYLNQLHKKQIPTFLVSANFRKSQVFFKKYGGWYRKFLSYFNIIFVQNENSRALLHSIGYNSVIVSGDTRFDRVAENAIHKMKFPLVEEFKSDAKIIVAGSTWPRDEELLVEYINSTSQNVKTIIASHEIHENKIHKLQNDLKKPSILYTQISEDIDLKEYQVLIINTIGILSQLYQYADLTYIGGGFGKGIHNTLEAAVFGAPIVFGPNYKHFAEATALVEKKGAFVVSNFENLMLVFDRFLNDEKLRLTTCNLNMEFVTQNLGATNKIMHEIQDFITKINR